VVYQVRRGGGKRRREEEEEGGGVLVGSKIWDPNRVIGNPRTAHLGSSLGPYNDMWCTR